METPTKPTAPISIVELEEFFFSQTAAAFAKRNGTDATIQHLRESFRLHRFILIAWLLQNGVQLPVELVDDRTHPVPGAQLPDQPVPAS
jgi:hypothetical protein